MPIHMDDILMAGKLETLKSSKENIKESFNISESGKVKKFLGVYYEWGCDAKGNYSKITMDKELK